MKHEFEAPKPPLPTYPKLGKGKTSGLPYIKYSNQGGWCSLVGGEVIHSAGYVEPLPAGTSLILTQE